MGAKTLEKCYNKAVRMKVKKEKRKSLYYNPRRRLVAQEVGRQIVEAVKAAKAGKKTGRGAVSVSKAMRKVGYSPWTSAMPQRITRHPSWPALVKEYFPDELVAEVHGGLIKSESVETIMFPLNVSDEKISEILSMVSGCEFLYSQKSGGKKLVYYTAPQNIARKLAIELVYKLKGRFAPQDLNLHFEDMSEEQLVNFIVEKLSKKD